MTVKTSISLTDQQAAFARRLVAEGRYSSVSAVVQHGLEALRRQDVADDAEMVAFREMLRRRANGPFVPAEEFDAMMEEMLAEESRKLGLEG